MTTASGVAVVATQLAQTDRRALSQAWYSALHVASADASLRPPSRARALDRASRATAPAATPPQATVRASGTPVHARAARERDRDAIAVERRRSSTDAARRVERALAVLTRTARPPSSHTVAIAGGRVTLLVRTDAHATRIVALCREPLRATVESALAHARFALAARGAAVAP